MLLILLDLLLQPISLDPRYMFDLTQSFYTLCRPILSSCPLFQYVEPLAATVQEHSGTSQTRSPELEA